MLFSSSEFIFAFLPLVYAGFLITQRLRLQHAAMVWLVVASLFFYGWWNPRYLLLIVGLIAINFWLGRLIGAAATRRGARLLLIAGLTINIGSLIYFKYANFLLDNFNLAAGTRYSIGAIILPLGISFFTFQKIAFLVDTYRGQVKRIGLLEFSLFVLFFPQLIAGPIVHHSEVVPQFKSFGRRRVSWDDLIVGLGFFFAGLFKKVVLADTLAAFAVTPVFASLAHNATPKFLEAWAGVLGYTLQLYFDFSGYSDMAIGAALLFGIRLPLNFNSPYKSTSIIDFWRRWHMTLSRFLRDYLYFALGGNRRGPLRRQINLMLTMLLGGIWHGAGWTYVIWGTLHGVYLAVNHAWRSVCERVLRVDPARSTLMGRGAAACITFLAVIVGWVFFRADSVPHALWLLGAMSGINGVELPAWLAGVPGVHILAGGAAYGHLQGALPFALIAAGLAWVWLLPNTQELFARFTTALGSEASPPHRPLFQFRYGWSSAILMSAVILVSLLYVRSNVAQEFLYFDF